MERGDAQILPPPGAGKVPGEGEKRMVRWCPCSKILQAHHVAIAAGIHKVSGGVHLDVGVLGLPHRVCMHGIEQLVIGGGLRGQMQKLTGGELEAEFPPQIWGLGLPYNIRVARGAAQVNVNYLSGGGKGCSSPLHHPPQVPPTGRSPPPFGGGRRGGLGTASGCRQQDRGGTAWRRAATKSAGTWSQKAVKKGFESCEKAKQWRVGQIHVTFVPNSYEFDGLVNL